MLSRLSMGGSTVLAKPVELSPTKKNSHAVVDPGCAQTKRYCDAGRAWPVARPIQSTTLTSAINCTIPLRTIILPTWVVV
jgi:hypothetical protein